MPATIEQFVPAWYLIDDSEICRLGQQSCHLGQDTCLGARARMAQSRFRVRLGPLDWSQMADFLPHGTAYPELCEISALATGPQFDFDLDLRLAPDSVPPLRLGVADDHGAPWLGWSTWLAGSTRLDEAGDGTCHVIIDGEAASDLRST